MLELSFFLFPYHAEHYFTEAFDVHDPAEDCDNGLNSPEILRWRPMCREQIHEGKSLLYAHGVQARFEIATSISMRLSIAIVRLLLDILRAGRRSTSSRAHNTWCEECAESVQDLGFFPNPYENKGAASLAI